MYISILFIHSYVDGHGLFSPFGYCECCYEHGVPVTDSLLSALLGIYLIVELLDHMVVLCSTFRGAIKLFSTVAATFYIPTSNA